MHLVRRQFLRLAAAAAFAPALPRMSLALDYPSRPITMIVPFPAGGPSDTIGRIVAEGMRKALGQIIIVENVTGATGTIGVARLVHAAADGYTIGIGNWPSNVVSGAVYPIRYDVQTDLEPVSLLADTPYWIMAKSTVPAKDLKELIGWLKTKSGGASVGTAGAGSGSQLCGMYLQQQSTGARLQFVPYRGTTPAMQDLLAGNIDVFCDIAAGSIAQVRAGEVKAYAVTSEGRWAAAPDTPTIEEAGLPAFHISAWTGLWVPKGTPRAIVARLNAAVMDALADPAVRSRLADLGQQIPPRERQTPEGLSALQKAEIEKWWPIIKAANIRAE
jgi:tripartite-type tricarboxylate transporter receptor subunit TctC